jgi:hypothetical protein
MIYAAIAISVISFCSGFWLSHELDKGELWQMENAIARQKYEAEAVLTGIIAKVEQQKAEQLLANDNLEKARQSSIETINAYHEKYNIARNVADRLRANANACGGSAMPEGHRAELHEEHEANGADFSTEFAGFLSGQAFKADQLAADYNALLSFVQSGCGLND